MQGKSKHTLSNPKYYEKNYKSHDFLAKASHYFLKSNIHCKSISYAYLGTNMGIL